jgi:hypothetical protein
MSDWDVVRADLGDKVVDALVAAISCAREELSDYREVRPAYAYEHSERGLANWIHDRIWIHIVRGLFDLPGVTIHEQGVTREVYVGTSYRLRFKRHDVAGMIRNYRTPTALAFWEADEVALPGMEETRLCFGYVWDAEASEIGEPVMTKRDGQDNVLWMIRLDEPDATGSAPVQPIVPPTTPPLPRIDLPQPDEQDGTGAE